MRRSHGRHGPRVGPAVAVEHREGPQVLGLVAHASLDDVAEGAQVRPAVRVHHALRTARRARGVVYGDGLFLVLEHVGDVLGRAFGQVVLVGSPASPVSSTRTVSTSSSTSASRSSSSASTKTIFAPECSTMYVTSSLPGGCLWRRAPAPRPARRSVPPAWAGCWDRERQPGRPSASPSRSRREARRFTRSSSSRVGVAPLAVDHGGLLREHVGAAPQKADRRKLAAVYLLRHLGGSFPLSFPNYSTDPALLFPIPGPESGERKSAGGDTQLVCIS